MPLTCQRGNCPQATRDRTCPGPQRTGLLASLGLLALAVGVVAMHPPAPARAQLPTTAWIAPDGEPLPFASDDEITGFLRLAEVIDAETVAPQRAELAPQRGPLDNSVAFEPAACRYDAAR